MPVTKRFKVAYDEIISMLCKGSGAGMTAADCMEATAKMSHIYDLQEELQEKLTVARQTNADLNRALRERRLELLAIEQRESSALREKTYDEWQKGAEQLLKTLAATRESLDQSDRSIHRRRMFEVVILGILVIANCLCIGTFLYMLF